MLPPGCARLATKPCATGSLTRDEHDRHSGSRRLDRTQPDTAVDRDHVRHPLPQLLCDAAGPLAVQHSPEVIDGDVAAGDPPGLFQSVSERSGAQLSLRVALNVLHYHCDPPHPFALLRAHRERPRRHRAAEYRDELASFHHSITSSARASSDGGTAMPSIRAVPPAAGSAGHLSEDRAARCPAGKVPPLALAVGGPVVGVVND